MRCHMKPGISLTLTNLSKGIEERDDPGEDLSTIGDWGEDVEGVEEEGEDDVEEIPEDEGSDEPVVAGLHLEGALVEQQNSQGEHISWRGGFIFHTYV